MKGVLTAVASVLAMGVLFAEASVSGSNNIVVVKKEVRQSSTGWQLLCVPVNGFDITSDGTEGTIDVNDFLPGDYYNEGLTVYIVNDDSGKPVLACTLGENKTWSGNTITLSGGQTIWVKEAEDVTTTTNVASLLALATGTVTSDDSQDPIYFCGQERARTTLERPDAGTIALRKNDSATAVALSSIVTAPVAGDEILTVQNGKKNYMSYYYNGSIWKNLYSREDSSAVTILPGEAFYYQSANE